MKTLNFKENKKQTLTIIAIAVALVLIGGGIAIAKSANKTDTVSTPTESTQTPTKTVTERTSVDANVTFDLDGFDWSVPALLSVTDATGATTYVAYDKPDNAKLTLPDATYTVIGVSPILTDGCIYITSDAVTVDKTTDTITITGVKLSADNVTDEQIAAIKDAYAKAKDAGVVSETVTATVDTHANAGAEARASKSDEEKAQATAEAKSEATTKHDEAVRNESSNSSSSNSNSSNNNASSSTPAAHTHSWTPVYRTVHHDAVTHEEPVYETKTTSQIYCTKHNVPHISQAEYDADPNRLGYCSADPNCLANTQRVYHTEQVQTGTKTVVDTAAYDEQVIDHCTCSCGATK